jgi:D-3-phosphoglycerate dehydrogenase / 2-oxoglutarate reductase
MNQASTRPPRVVLIAGRRVADVLDVSRLEAAGLTVERRFDLENSPDEARLVEALAGSSGVVAGGEQYSRAVLGALPSLRIVARMGVGHDRVDVPAATELGTLVSITPGTIEPAVAEWTIAHILAVRRRLLQADRAVRDQQWTLPDVLGPSLIGATVGIVGLGRIGREVVNRLAGFGCSLIATDPVADAAEWAARGVTVVPLDELLRQSDVVTLHIPLSEATRNLIGRREIALMRPTAIIVNTSRGGLIDEDALLTALREGRIAGAGLDVFATEPVTADHPLLGLDNVVMTGHVAYATHAAAQAAAQGAIDAVLSVALGRLPSGVLNPEAVKKRPLAPFAAVSV